MWTGAVYREAAATHGIPDIGLWFAWRYEPDCGCWAEFGAGVGDDEFETVGDVVGDVL